MKYTERGNNMTRPVFSFTDRDIKEYGKIRFVEFDIPGGITTPGEYADAVEEGGDKIFAPSGRGIIISGRDPIWGYAMILHAAHPARWIATMDPRLGPVVVQSHTPGVSCGEVIPLSLLENKV
jgi:CRISPR-associated protein Csx3